MIHLETDPTPNVPNMGIDDQKKAGWLVFWGCLFLVAGVFFCLNAACFKIRQVVIRGNRNVPKEVIIRTLGINRNQNIFSLRPCKRVAALLTIPDVARAKVIPLLPNRVFIRVWERKPQYRLSFGKRQVLVGDDAAIMGWDTMESSGSLPLVTGISCRFLRVGTRLGGTQSRAIQEIFQASDRNLQLMIRKIDLKANQLWLELPGRPGPVGVDMGNLIQIREKITNLRAILARNEYSDIVRIDLRVSGISTITTVKNKNL